MKTETRTPHILLILGAAVAGIAALGWLLGPTSTPALAEAADPEPTVSVYLPLVMHHLPVCGQMNAQELALADLMVNDPRQQRPSLTCNDILAQVARERAEDMAARNYFGHINPDGYGPNYLVTQAGYVLPSWYPITPNANSIESISAGRSSAETAWNDWMISTQHRQHLVGEIAFFAEQIEYGIGYASGGDYGHYWVVITAKPGP